jgi:hypothetical protein
VAEVMASKVSCTEIARFQSPYLPPTVCPALVAHPQDWGARRWASTPDDHEQLPTVTSVESEWRLSATREN